MKFTLLLDKLLATKVLVQTAKGTHTAYSSHMSRINQLCILKQLQAMKAVWSSSMSFPTMTSLILCFFAFLVSEFYF